MDAYLTSVAPVLVLPVRGRPVRVPAPTARVGLELRHRMLTDPTAGIDEWGTVSKILGPDLFADLSRTLPEPLLLHVARTALLHWCGNPDAAVLHWDPDATPAEEAAPVDPSAPGYLGPTDPGGGPIDEATGIRDWYNPREMAPGHREPLRLTWRDIFTCWHEIDLDLHERFGIDLGGDVLDRRPLPWLERRIRDLAHTPGTRLHRTITAPATPKG